MPVQKKISTAGRKLLDRYIKSIKSTVLIEKIMTDSYDADAIKILAPTEVTEKFEWAEIGGLAHQYGMSAKLIQRGFAACAQVGVDPSYFVRRYLAGDKTVPFDPAVDEAYRALPR